MLQMPHELQCLYFSKLFLFGICISTFLRGHHNVPVCKEKIAKQAKGKPWPSTNYQICFDITFLEIHYYMVLDRVKRIKSAKPCEILYPANCPTGKTTVNHHVPHLLQTQIMFLPFGRNYILEGKTNLCWHFICLFDTFIAKSGFLLQIANAQVCPSQLQYRFYWMFLSRTYKSKEKSAVEE